MLTIFDGCEWNQPNKRSKVLTTSKTVGGTDFVLTLLSDCLVLVVDSNEEYVSKKASYRNGRNSDANVNAAIDDIVEQIQRERDENVAYTLNYASYASKNEMILNMIRK